MPETPEIPEELPLADEAAVVAEVAASLPEGEAAVSQEICGGTPTSQNRDVGHPATEEVPETAKENEPMIDIHVPQATHTWKDFWIHLGTITAGLLIAISLEQSVEKLHQLHQRHELEASLRAEGEVNKERAEIGFSRYDEQMTWLLGLHEDIGRMQATGGKANLPYREVHSRPRLLGGIPFTDNPVLSTAVWDTASADSRLALLPDDVANSYSFLYRGQMTILVQDRLKLQEATARQEAFEALFADKRTPTTPVLARMSAAKLEEYDALVMESFTAARDAKAQLRTVYGNINWVRQGLYDRASAHRTQVEAHTAFADDYGKMADQIEAKDAARDKAAEKGK
jgi:hypothetical protein